MKITFALLVASSFALLACQNTTGTAPVPSGGSAGAMGEQYCEVSALQSRRHEQLEQALRRQALMLPTP